MLVHVLILYALMTVSAVALHDNTFAVFELREQLQMLYLNMWELLHQLEYVTDEQRAVVYGEIDDIRQQIWDTIELLKQHDQTEHP